MDEPNKLYALTPRSNDAKDLVDITYGQFANAINAVAWWLDEELGPSTDVNFPSFAYLGPKDLQYTIIAMAALKVRRRVILCSLFIQYQYKSLVRHLQLR